jgi:thioredoxin-related protein
VDVGSLMEEYSSEQQLKARPDEILVLVLTEQGCPHCLRFETDFPKICSKLDFLQIRWVRACVQKHSDLKKRFEPEGVPAFYFWSEGEPKGSVIGYKEPTGFITQIVRSFTGC